jgi:hypothetical protein
VTITKFNVVMNNQISIIQLGLTQLRFLKKCITFNIQYEKDIGFHFSRSPIRFYFQIVCFEDDSRRLRFNFLAAQQCERVRREEKRAPTHTLANTHTLTSEKKVSIKS